MAEMFLRRRANNVRANLTISGLERFKKNLENLSQLQGFDAELEYSAQAIVATAAEILGQVTSESSSTKLASSLTVTSGDQEFSKRIGTEFKYAAFVEFGTVRTPPRPWLSTALVTEKPVIKNRLRELLLRNATSKQGVRK
jgi:HK97 gp10 family phage protein